MDQKPPYNYAEKGKKSLGFYTINFLYKMEKPPYNYAGVLIKCFLTETSFYTAIVCVSTKLLQEICCLITTVFVVIIVSLDISKK